MKIGIYTNLNKDKELVNTTALINAARKYSEVKFAIENVLSPFFPSIDAFDVENLAKNCDVVISLGGDGTILKIAYSCAKYDTPILGVNLGTLGFLTESENNDFDSLLKILLSGQYKLESRSLLKSQTDNNTYYSLNEIMIGRSKNLKMVPTEVYIDDNFYYCYYADGVMVSTVTGSTAYSLSAGGPVLSPKLKGFVINSVCPHSLQNKAVVISEDQTVTLKTLNSRRAILYSDGEIVEELSKDCSVLVSKADIEVKFIRFNNVNFYNRLIEKLNHWSKM